jgi:hypothetical protein
MLKSRFKHKHWFVGQSMTVEEFLDYVLEKNGDFYIKTKTKPVSDYLLDHPITEYYLSDNRYSYKLDDEDCIYLSMHSEYFNSKLTQ